MDLGFGLGSSTENHIYGWPELALTYKYLEYFIIDMRVSGDFNLYNAESASKEYQFFSLNPDAEYKWVYSLSMAVNPHPVFSMGIDFSYNDYKSKRIYEYNSEMQSYGFNTVNNVDIFDAGLTINLKTANIFNMAVIYNYQNIPNDWLLYMPHRLDIIVDLGYKPSGFNFRTHYNLYAPRLLEEGARTGFANLLNFKISQKILKYAEIFIEVNNVLNQDIKFTEGTLYGGIQANGGITVNF